MASCRASSTRAATTVPLPTQIAGVSATVNGIPAGLYYVSPGQINLQVPWELQNQTSAQVKVTIDFSYGNVVTLQLSNYAPAFFEIGNGNVAALRPLSWVSRSCMTSAAHSPCAVATRATMSMTFVGFQPSRVIDDASRTALEPSTSVK